MKIATGTVTRGQIVFDGEPFAEGEKVTILGPEEERFTLTPEQNSCSKNRLHRPAAASSKTWTHCSQSSTTT